MKRFNILPETAHRFQNRKRYVILVAAALFQLCLGGIYAWSYFIPRLESEFGVSSGQAQNIFGVCILVFTASMIAGGRWQQRRGPRRVALTGAVCYGCAYLGAGLFATDFVGFLLFKGILEGIGIGLGYVCPLTVALQWFPRRKGLATGFVVGGFGAGAIVLSAVAHQLFELNLSVSGVFVRLGIGYLVIASLAAAFLSPPPRNRDTSAETQPESTVPKLAPLLREGRFWTLTAGMFAGTFGGLMVIGSLNPIGLEGGLSNQHAVLAISIFSVGNSSGRFIWGLLFDRFGKITIPASLVLLALAMSTLLPSRQWHPLAFSLNAGLVGFSFAACFVLYAAQTAVFFTPAMVGTAYPIIFLLGYGFPGIFGPGTGGLLHQSTGGFQLPILLAAAMAFLGALITKSRLDQEETLRVPAIAAESQIKE